MGVKVRKEKGVWCLKIDHLGNRRKKVIGKDRKVADEVKRQVEAQLALGDIGILGKRQKE